MDKKLIKAVLKQMNIESAEDLTSLEDLGNFGANCGYAGFTYYSDTCEFYRKNKKAIKELCDEMVESIGYRSIADMIQGFNCIGKDYSLDSINEVIYSNTNNEDRTIIENALAWFTAEEVANHYINLNEDEKQEFIEEYL